MPSTTEQLRDLVTAGVQDRVYPGAVWAVGDATGTIDRGATGLLNPTRPDEPMAPDTVFDVASLDQDPRRLDHHRNPLAGRPPRPR